MNVKIEWGNDSNARISHYFYIKYDWYGYEGVGHCRCEYKSSDLNKIQEFLDFCKLPESTTFKEAEEYGEQMEKFFGVNPNGYLVRHDSQIYKRTTIDDTLTKEDLVIEKRNSNLATLLRETVKK